MVESSDFYLAFYLVASLVALWDDLMVEKLDVLLVETLASVLVVWKVV